MGGEADGDEEELEETTLTVTPEDRDSQERPRGEHRPVLVVLSGAGLGRACPVVLGKTLLGRGTDVDLFVDDDGVSRHHAQVTLHSDGSIVLEDLGSTNGTFIDDRRIESHRLRDGDRIRLSSKSVVKFGYEDEIEAEVRQQLFAAATRDALTGVHNKRSFTDELTRSMAFCKRHGQPLSLVVFDLDHFKKLNDTRGHPAGDVVLREAARNVVSGLRTEDLVARVGGEEFAIILAGNDERQAVLAAERLRARLERLEVSVLGEPVRVTVSLGVAEYSPSEHRLPEDLVAAADQRLYAAKRAGRNCVRPAPPPMALVHDAEEDSRRGSRTAPRAPR